MAHDIDEPIFHPGDVSTLQTDWDPEEWRSVIHRSGNTETLRWWKAYPNPSYVEKSGQPNAQGGEGRWRYVEQDCEGKFVLVQAGKLVQRYIPASEVQTGDVVIVFMPDEIELGAHDIIAPLGRYPYLDSPAMSQRMRERKDWQVRGVKETRHDGTVSSSGRTVTGVGTSFSTALRRGDTIKAAGQACRVSSVASDTSLTLSANDAAPSPAWSGNDWFKCTDPLLDMPTVRVEWLGDLDGDYAFETDFEIGADTASIQWLTDSGPAPGGRYAVITRYFPRYVILPDYGAQRKAVSGVRLPTSLVARMHLPETQKR